MTTVALPTAEARHETRSAAALPNWHRRLRASLHLEGDGAMSMAIAGNVSFPVSTCVQSTEIVTLQGEQDEVHSVVVDMPQVISLKYASPETWDELPTVQPYEQPPATPVLQVALSVGRLALLKLTRRHRPKPLPANRKTRDPWLGNPPPSVPERRLGV